MKRKLAVVALLISAVMIAGGCTLIQVNEERDAKVVVAQVDGTAITKGEFLSAWNQMRLQYGITDQNERDSSVAETVKYLKEYLLDSMVEDEVMEQEARKRGYFDLTNEQRAEIEEEMASILESLRESIERSMTFEEGLTDEQKAALVDAELNSYREEIGYTDEYIRSTLENSKAISALYEEVTNGATAEESALDARYNEKITADRTSYEVDADAYVDAVLGGKSVYYVPKSGMRLIQQILIMLPADARSQISALRKEGDNEGADEKREEALDAIRDKAEEVLSKLEGGADFDDMIEEYNEDPGMEAHPDGYPVNDNVTSYAPEFMQGAMALEKQGDISGLIATDYGYHILRYAGSLKDGAVPFEDVREQLREEVLNENKQKLWSEALEQWKSARQIKTYPKRIR